MNSERGAEWAQFEAKVLEHIETYTVPQYGDKPVDQLHVDMGFEDIRTCLRRYVNRIGTNSRGPAEALRDCLKIAHYACVLHGKLDGTGGRR
jgi:hypothetical protein